MKLLQCITSSLRYVGEELLEITFFRATTEERMTIFPIQKVPRFLHCPKSWCIHSLPTSCEEMTNTNSIDTNVNYNSQKTDISWDLVADGMERKEFTLFAGIDPSLFI